MQGYRVERRRDQLLESQQVPENLVAADGEVIARVDAVAITSNNVTYALHGGPPLHYWSFYPASNDDWCVVPLWGYAEIVESRAPGVAVGSRYWGYWPSASHCRLQPGKVRPDGFMDMSAHRQERAPAYNRYRLATEAADVEAATAVFAPLYGTGFMLAHFLKDTAGDATVIITSASAKTGLGTGFALSQLGGVKTLALTSAGNRDFVAKTGFFDATASYDDIESLDPDMPAVLVDLAGNASVKRRIHEHMKGLRASHLVGGTHGERAPQGPLPGPEPVMFFAPSVGEAMARAMGADVFAARMAASLQAFLKAAEPWLKLESVGGAAGYDSAFQALLTGQASPAEGLVWKP